jgi:DUF1365 family protein
MSCHGLQGKEVETVVAEVSNTPWNEMHCYVLNPKTKGVTAKVSRAEQSSSRDVMSPAHLVSNDSTWARPATHSPDYQRRRRW